MKYTILLISSLLVLSFSAIAQSTYRWVDSNGQVHYSSKPPAVVEANVKKPEAKEETTASLAARLRAEEKAKQENQKEQVKDNQVDKKEVDDKQAAYNQAAQEKAAQDGAQLKVVCESMRKDLATYTNYPRAKVNVDGVVRRLTSEELSTKINDLQSKIKENCQDY
ncbi:DUF4124 domain-containing protein [Entomomonas moraniae]|nr:DUF4124 domain-containing protein [Entomomonas moraniae]